MDGVCSICGKHLGQKPGSMMAARHDHVHGPVQCQGSDMATMTYDEWVTYWNTEPDEFDL